MSPVLYRNQRGTALVVSLIILAVVSLLGISSMSNSNTELKLVSSQRDRSLAFEAAEAALTILERELYADPPEFGQLFSNCSSTDCFNATCDGGVCFAGYYLAGFTQFECEVTDPTSSTLREEFWRDSNLDVWGNEARHRTVEVANLASKVKYITEFLCYSARSPQDVFDETEPNNGVPAFRITVLAEGNGDRAAVALQATYKVIHGN